MRQAEAQGRESFLQAFNNQAHRAPPASPAYIQFVKEASDLPVIVKGILTGEVPRFDSLKTITKKLPSGIIGISLRALRYNLQKDICQFMNLLTFS